MKKLKFFLSLLMLFTFSIGTMWAADVTISITRDSVTSTGSFSYGNDYDWSALGTTGQLQVTANATELQFNGAKPNGTEGVGDGKVTKSRRLWNTTATPGRIKSIKIKWSGTGTARKWKVFCGTSAATSTSDTTSYGTRIGGEQTLTEEGAIWNVPGGDDYTYFMCYLTDNSASYVSSVEVTYEVNTTTPTISVEKSGSAITELDFGEQEPAADYVSKTFDLKASNLTGNVYITPSNTAKYKIAAEGYPNGLAYLTVKPTAGAIDTTITILASTLNSGTYNETLSLTSTTEPKEFSDVSLDLKLKVLGPEVILKSNSTLDPIDEINFGNVGKNRDKSAQFAFSFKRLETGTLTITVSDDFAFSGDSPTKEIEITSASGTNTDVSIFKNTTTVKNITNGWLKFTGCGLPSEGVFYDVKMNVKEPTVSINITSTQDNPYDFGSIRQHTVCSECGGDLALKTIHIQAQYLASDIFTGETGAIYDLDPSRIYIDEDGAVDQDLNVYISTGTAGTYAYDRFDDNKNWKMRIYSGAVTPEFEEIYIYPSVTITPTYRVDFQVNDNDRGTITINGVESNEYGRAAAYVADGSEDITMVATPKLGYKFTEWQVAYADESKVTINAPTSASTYANVSSEPSDYITAVFEFDCTALDRPSDAASLSETYNSANLKWQWVWEGSNKVATYHLHAYETANPSVEIDKDLTFTSEELDAGSTLYYTLTDLKGSTAYTVQVWGTSVTDGYCPTGKVAEITFTTPDYPDATLTLSENGTTHALSGSHKVADVVTLPSTVTKEVVGKVFVGWSSLTIETPTDTKPGVATFWEPGASYTILSETDKLYAVYATATPGVPSSHNLGTATLNGSSTGSNTASANYSLYLTSTTDKAGYVQDKGTAGESVISVKLYVTNSESQIISSQPSAIKVIASLGGGSAKNPLDNSVYAVLLDNNNDELGDAVVLTTSIAGQSGTDYTASLPIANYADVRGVKVYHLKEDGYNVRYYSVDFKYETGGENTYSQYTTKGAKILSDLTFSPAEGTKTSATNVEISSPDGGTIYYTTDGTAPTDASTVYTGAIALTTYGEHVIKAIAIDGDDQSEVATATYFLNLPFASLEDLVAANLASGTTNVTVSFSNVEITDINNSNRSVYLNVKDNGGVNNIQLFNYTALTESWMVGGKLSGTITCTWTEYSSKWELVITSWTTGITYTKPASGLEWSAASATAYTVGKSYELPTLTNAKSLAVAYSSTTTSVATIDSESGVVTLVGAGSTTIKATASDAYADNEVSYTLTVTAPSTLLISGTLTKQDYELGDAIDPTGLVATVKYGNNDTWDPSDATFEFSQDPIVMGQTTVQAWAHWNAMTSAISESLTARMKYHKVVAATGIEHGSIAIKDGSSTASTGADYWKGKSLKVVATPDSKYELDKIYINGVEQSGVVDNELTFDVPGTDPAGADITVSATFKKLPKAAAGLAWSVSEKEMAYGGSYERFHFPTMTNPNEIPWDDIELSSSDADVAEFGATTHEGSSWTARVTLKKPGTATMTAYFAGNDDYEAATVSYELTIIKGTVKDNQLNWYLGSEYQVAYDTVVYFTQGSHSFLNLSNGSLSLPITYESTDETVAKMTNGLYPDHPVVQGVGETTIRAIFEGNDYYNAKTVEYLLTVEPGEANLAWGAASVDATYGSSVSYPALTNDREVTVVYSSSNESVATINAETGVVTLKGNGTTTITATTNDSRVKVSSASYTLNVSAGIVTTTPSPLALDLGDVLYQDELTQYKQTFHLHIENLKLGEYNQVRIDFEGSDFYAFGIDGDVFVTGYNYDGIIDKDIAIIPSNYGMSYSFAQVGGQRTASIKVTQTGSPVQMPSVIVGTVTMNIVEAYAITATAENGTLTFNGNAAPKVAAPGSTFTLAATPESGYKANGITVQKVSDESDVTADVLAGDVLTMPSYAIKVVAAFVEDTGTALDDLESGEKVVKVLDNGVVYIIRDGARYNLLGEKVK